MKLQLVNTKENFQHILANTSNLLDGFQGIQKLLLNSSIDAKNGTLKVQVNLSSTQK
jgi:hypothetical protein